MHTLDQSQLSNDFIDCPIQMARAIQLAETVLSARPNPRVGCVLVKDGKVVGEGWHAAAGQAHAEVMALNAAGDDAKDATAIVTLEPCSHHGRTGPCSQALINAGVKRVIIASLDPNPLVSGQGVQQMEEAGIEVYHLAQFEQAARKLNPGYFKRREQSMPFVTLKLAMSLDGRTALENGKSKWITGPEARADVQRMRLRSSAVLTGIKTVLIDDPALTVRPDEMLLTEAEQSANRHLLEQAPLRVIADSQMQTPGTAKILQAEGEVLIYSVKESALLDVLSTKASVQLVPETDGSVDLRSVLESLATKNECNDVMVECGPTLAAALLQAGLVDEMVVYIAPKILGADARPLFGITGLQSLEESWGMTIIDQQQIGSDCRLTLVPN